MSAHATLRVRLLTGSAGAISDTVGIDRLTRHRGRSERDGHAPSTKTVRSMKRWPSGVRGQYPVESQAPISSDHKGSRLRRICTPASIPNC